MRNKLFDVNTVGADYVVGDIHGCFTKLQQALNEIGFNPETDRLFSVGDLVDRGPESEEALNWLAKPWFHAIAGNHEQMAIDANSGLYDKSTYQFNGGQWFIDMEPSHQREFAEAFKKLPLAMTIKTNNETIGIVHGDAPNDWNLIEEIHEHWLLWGRQRITRKNTELVKNIDKVFVGHTPVKEKLIYGNVHFIDTGAVFGKPFHIEQIN